MDSQPSKEKMCGYFRYMHMYKLPAEQSERILLAYMHMYTRHTCQAKRKCVDILAHAHVQTSCLLPSKRKPEDRDLLFLRRVEMIVFLSSNQMDLRCR